MQWVNRNEFHPFKVPLNPMSGLVGRGYEEAIMDSDLGPLDGHVYQTAWQIPLPANLQQRHGVEYVTVAFLSFKNFEYNLGATINDPDVFEHIRCLCSTPLES